MKYLKALMRYTPLYCYFVGLCMLEEYTHKSVFYYELLTMALLFAFVLITFTLHYAALFVNTRRGIGRR